MSKTAVKKTETSDDFFDLDKSSEANAFREKKSKSDDGIYRPSLDKLKKKGGTYEATIRFLPNLDRDTKKWLSGAIPKTTTYVKDMSNPLLNGYYDSQKDLGMKDELIELYWKFYNSKDAQMKEKCELFKNSKKYFQYVLIIEDENQPELEGKILIFPYGVKIYDKILTKSEDSKKPCRVEDLATGRNLLLRVKEVGGYVNYDTSEFDDVSAIELPVFDGDGKLESWETISTTKVDGKLLPSKDEQQRIIDFLFSREVELSTYNSKKWSDEQQKNVNLIIQELTGTSYHNNSNISNEDLFDEDDEDKQDVVSKNVSSKTTRNAKSNVKESTVEVADDDFFNDLD